MNQHSVKFKLVFKLFDHQYSGATLLAEKQGLISTDRGLDPLGSLDDRTTVEITCRLNRICTPVPLLYTCTVLSIVLNLVLIMVIMNLLLPCRNNQSDLISFYLYLQCLSAETRGEPTPDLLQVNPVLYTRTVLYTYTLHLLCAPLLHTCTSTCTEYLYRVTYLLQVHQ